MRKNSEEEPVNWLLNQKLVEYRYAIAQEEKIVEKKPDFGEDGDLDMDGVI